jgi:hypothetical protein
VRDNKEGGSGSDSRWDGCNCGDCIEWGCPCADGWGHDNCLCGRCNNSSGADWSDRKGNYE